MHHPAPMSTDQSCNDKFNNYQLYVKHVGLPNYLAGQTRPDFLYFLLHAAQNYSFPKLSDMIRIKRIIRYIKHTKDIGITFNCDDDLRLVIHIYYEGGKGHTGISASIGENNDVSSLKKEESGMLLYRIEKLCYERICVPHDNLN